MTGALSPGVQASPVMQTGGTEVRGTAGAGLARSAAAAGSGSSVTQTNTWMDSNGTSRSGTVTVSQTSGLSTRQVVNISWSGFLPTVNSQGADSVHQAPQTPRASGYPVVLMECQGSDAAKMTPNDCAMTGPHRFYQYAVYDANETDAVHKSSIVDSRPFTETSGKVDSAPTGQLVTLPSDFNDSNVIGTNWYATWTNPDGTHNDARFEVRSVQEAPQSLGCGDPKTRSHGACSIVVVPVRPLPCVDASSCPPPNSYLGLSADYNEWQSASNWRNKFVFPVSFKPFPTVCELDHRIAVPTQGSEMLDQAMLSWLPKFCTSSNLFKLGFTRVNDSTARNNLDFQIAGQYTTNLAFTTQPALSIRGRPVVNSPVAVTGFAVAVQLDGADFEQVSQVNLNARLLAKLITESYNAPPDPNVKNNPEGLFQDPEFAKLNPGLVQKLPPDVKIRNPILVQGSPDLVYEVTRYIASDKTAVAWLKGTPDPWGMKVNPYYQGDKWQIPTSTFGEQDPYIWKADTRPCPEKPVMEQVAQFVYDLSSVADAMINRQPQDYSLCKVVGQSGTDYAWAHSDRQLLGSRAMLAIMDIPSADAYQFPMAALENHAGKFVTPTDTSLTSALQAATLDHTTGTLSANLQSNSPTAYPGLMPVYAAAPTYGLTKAQAHDFALMMTWLSTSGQVHGDAAGQLPAGYLAMPQNLRAQAAAAAKHVRAQDCFGALKGDNPCSPSPPSPPPRTPPRPPTRSPHSTGTPTFPVTPTHPYTPPPGSVPGAGTVPSSSVPTSPISTPTTPTPSTQPAAFTSTQESALAAHLLPVLLVIGLIGLLAAPLLVVASRPGGVASLRRGWRAWRKKRFGKRPPPGTSS
jgi:hypothetical protein